MTPPTATVTRRPSGPHAAGSGASPLESHAGRSAPDGVGLGLLLLGWALVGAYLWLYLDRGWVAHDDGALAQSAERVLAGELPHRDFRDIYTGGLAVLHALAFRVLGVDLVTLRVVLWLAVMAWVPALFYVATRVLSTTAAAAAVLVGVAWSVPNYFAALPSWYNLFLATAGAACLLRAVETERSRWLFLAGACGGISFLIKLSGLFYVAAALLFLVYRERVLSRRRGVDAGPVSRAYLGIVVAAVTVFVLLLALMLRSRLGGVEIVHFLLPGALVASLVALEEWREPARGTPASRVAALARVVAPFALGLALPVALFLLPYLQAGALADFVEGVFVAPARRLDSAARRPPFLGPSLKAMLAWGVVMGLAYFGRLNAARTAFLLGALGALLLALVPETPALYRGVFYSVRALVPTLSVAGFALLVVRRRQLSEPHRQRMLVLLAVTALCSLVQYPYSAPVYFCYVAPLAAVLLLSLVPPAPAERRAILGLVWVFFLLFGALWLNRGFVYSMGLSYRPHGQTERLALPRGGIRVGPEEAEQYRELVGLLRRVAGGPYILATPDAPEVYFLSGYRNPTRDLFEFLGDTAERPERLLATLETRGVRAVVINTQPGFSAPVAPALLAELRARYPERAEIGKFEVRWKR